MQHTLLRFEVQLSEHCNLNCRGCTHNSPLANEEFLDLKQYENDLSALSKLFDSEVEWIHLLGGEPLLNPDVVTIMKMTRKYFQHGRIMLVTNGILLRQMPNAFWKAAKESDIEICPTKYPIKIDYDALQELAEHWGVKYENYDVPERVTLWRWGISPMGRFLPEVNYAKCGSANTCITLRDGKLYTCEYAAHAKILNEKYKLGLFLSDRNGVDIYSVSTPEELMEKLDRPIPFCKYCNIDGKVTGIPWERTEYNRYEWVDFEFNKVDIEYLRDKNVIIYGAGKYARETLKRLRKNDIKVTKIVVTSLKDNPNMIDETCVYAIDQLEGKDLTATFLAAVSNEKRNGVYQTLRENGFRNVIFINI